MKIYIPRHLLKLPLINQMAQLIQAYSQEITGEEEWQDNWLVRNDPVLKFLYICINNKMIGEGQDIDSVISYLAKLFYSVKGTLKVFEYMKKYLGLEIDGDITYNVSSISLRVSNVNQTNEENFSDSLENFLRALVYFRDMKLEMNGVDLDIESSISNNVGGNSLTYRIFQPVIYDFL